MKIAVAASPEVALPTLELLLTSGHDLALVISRPDSPVGRGRELTATAVSNWAMKKGIELYRPSLIAEFDNRLTTFDLVITIGYGLLLPEVILNQPKFGFINLHFSLLPKLRGAAPAQRAIIEGLTETGVTVFKLDPGMDTGPIYIQEKFSIRPETTAGELLVQLAQLGPGVIAKTLIAIENGTEPTPQDDAQASYAAKLNKSEGQINWQESSAVIVNKIMGFSPNPGATASFRGEVLRLNRAKISEVKLSPREILVKSASLYVGTSTTAVEILDLTPAGKRSMSAFSWANGARISDGELIE